MAVSSYLFMLSRITCTFLKYRIYVNFQNPTLSSWLDLQIIQIFRFFNRYVLVNITLYIVCMLSWLLRITGDKILFKRSFKSPKRFRCMYQAKGKRRKINLWTIYLWAPNLIYKENMVRENYSLFQKLAYSQGK